MPLFMDIHVVESDSFSIQDVVSEHMKDLEVQEAFGVRHIKYWVNEAQKTIFCLMYGPDKESCHKVHETAHGITACNIIEVNEDLFDDYLGEGSKNGSDLALTSSGEVDTGYRSILLLRSFEVCKPLDAIAGELRNILARNNGVILKNPEQDLMASFVYASNAWLAALELNRYLKDKAFDHQMTLVTGKPVDPVGNNLFEKTLKKLKVLCMIGTSNAVIVDEMTYKLIQKQNTSPRCAPPYAELVEESDIDFLEGLYRILLESIPDPCFDNDKLISLLGMSRSKAYRRIKSLTGRSPNRLLQEMRLYQSLERLKSGSENVSEIAYSLGFNSPAYFTRVFKSKFGLIPSAITNG
jgi:AraC-like DNA-binding protein